LLEEGSKDDIERMAPRPTYTCLDVGAVESTLGRSKPTLRADVETL
jgi:dTDP-4-dehydrorhamnose reductase